MTDHVGRRTFLAQMAASGLAAGTTPSFDLATRLTADEPTIAPVPIAATPRERLLLDFGWRFRLGHADDPLQDFGFGRGQMYSKVGSVFTPARQNFDDSGWRAVDLPHDWAVDLPFQNVAELIEFGAKPLGRAYPATSIGWYRRTFEIPASDAGRRLSLEFDGVYRDCMVVLNGHVMARNESGYAPFRIDISDYVNLGGRNVLVVRADATGRDGWFYEGAGIYRHVWLVKTSPVHVTHWGTFATADVTRGAALVTIVTEVENDTEQETSVRVAQRVLGPGGAESASGRSAAVRVGAHARVPVTVQLTVRKPALWSIETPALHNAVTTIEVAGAEVDRVETTFGIRTVRFDAERGFFLNGTRVAIKGTCNHQDHAGVGAALPDRLQSYRIERLKAFGSNAYRTSHNPPTPELLDACDRLGMLVLDETRLFATTDDGLGQLETLIRRDRNHPSVFCWSIANEEWVVQGNDVGARIAATMTSLAHRLDPTRPVTAAMNGSWGKGVSDVVDVQGCNYERPTQPGTNSDTFHRAFPRKPMLGTEVASTVSTRGIYVNDEGAGYVSAYDVNKPPWGSTAEWWWTYFDTRPHLSGGFVWTGFDYRGEPTPYAWPCISSHFGILDTCGFPKDNFYYYQAWWGDKPVLHLFPHWNWPGRDGQEVEVWCHTNLERVELLVNGTSAGVKDVRRNTHVAWKVPYVPGAIVARGFRGGQSVMEVTRETVGPAARLVLRPDRSRIAADGEDVSVVEVQVVDARERIVPRADHEITFKVSAPGKLIGVGNGDPSSHESDRGPNRRAFSGLCMALVQGTKTAGEIRLDASAPGLEPASVVIVSAAATPRPAV